MNNNPYGDIKKSVCIYIYIYIGLSFLGSGVLFPFSVSCCGLAFGVSCVYFLCTKGRLYAFLISLFLPIKKKYIYIFL
jgi:hypothetical protein